VILASVRVFAHAYLRRMHIHSIFDMLMDLEGNNEWDLEKRRLWDMA